MAKQQPSIVIDKLGTHLFQVTNNHTGQVNLKWDWDKLLEEVQAATAGRRVQHVQVDVPEGKEEEFIGNVKKAVAKKNLVKETETKVKKTRAKSVVNDQITDAVTAKKPAAKKAPAKATAKKAPAKKTTK